MSPDNAKLVTDTITLCVIVYVLLVLYGKIDLKKKSDFIERYKPILKVIGWIGLLYPVYSICSILFGFKQY